MEYIEAEQCMVVSSKTHFYSLDETEERRPPQLTLQLWDNDLILHDDFLSKKRSTLRSAYSKCVAVWMDQFELFFTN